MTCCNTTASPSTCAGCCASTTFVDLSYRDLVGTVPSDLFSHLPALTRIDLYSNALVSLPVGLFANLSALKYLGLYSNKLAALPVGIFEDNVGLETLIIGSNAFVQPLPASLLDRNVALKEFGIQYNKLTAAALPSGLFAHCPALALLNLQGNELTVLPGNIFAANASSLKTLQIDNNQLSPLGLLDSAFNMLHGLTTLILSNNNIYSLPLGLFTPATHPSLSNIELVGNTFVNASCAASFSDIASIPAYCFSAFSSSLSPSPSIAPSVAPTLSLSPSLSASPPPSPSRSPSTSPSATAAGQLFRPLPRTDLLGTLVGAAAFFSTASEAACRFACLAAPGCDAYAFSAGALALLLANIGLPDETAPCYLYANVTALVPSSPMNAGVLYARYS